MRLHFIDGYPGKYCVIARRNGDRWYIAGINAGKEPMKLTLPLSMLADRKVRVFNDEKNKVTYTKEISIPQNGVTEVEMQPGGGFVITQ
jgi:hypothetical protein